MSEAAIAHTSGRRERMRIYACVTPFLILVVLWLTVVVEAGYEGQVLQRGPNGIFLGSDFAMFFGAAQTARDGGNPYDRTLLYRTEASVLHRQGLPVLRESTLVRVGNPPLFLWALEPLTILRFQAAAYLWIGFMLLSAVIGFLAALRYLGWRRRLWPCLLFVAMPQVFEGAFTGNVIPLVFAAMSLALLLMRRFPLAAGLLLGVAWLKPQVALPLAALIVLFECRDRLRVGVGIAVATALMVAGSVASLGTSVMADWLRGLEGYSRDIAPQGDIASLAGLYYRWAPANLRLSLGVLSLVIAVGLTAFWWRRNRECLPLPPLTVAWLWFAWFLATPYAHFYDQILLAVPVLALLGRDGANIARASGSRGRGDSQGAGFRLGMVPGLAVVAVPYLMFLSVIPYNVSLPKVQLLWLPILLAGVCLAISAHDHVRWVRRRGFVVMPGFAAEKSLDQVG